MPPGVFAVAGQLANAKGSCDAGELSGRFTAQPDRATEIVVNQAAIGKADLHRDNELPPARFEPTSYAGGDRSAQCSPTDCIGW